MKIDFSHASLPKIGEFENGDSVVFRADDEGRALIAVIDGLGHGPEAARVARTVSSYLNGVSLETALIDMMHQAHKELAGSRGVAATLCVLRDSQAEACAVGNVELRTGDLRLPLVYSAGILGVRVNKFHICRVTLRSQARFVLFSDGISSRTPVDEMRRFSPKATCDAIIEKYRRKEDDATIVVADVE